MDSSSDNIIHLDSTEARREAYIQELQRLLACYQLASRDDINAVWAILNKYAPYIDLNL